MVCRIYRRNHVGRLGSPVCRADISQCGSESETSCLRCLRRAASTFAVVAYFVRQRVRFQDQSDRLLRNVLPEEIAVRLKQDHAEIADYYEEASVLFADVVGFTPLSAQLTPQALVAAAGAECSLIWTGSLVLLLGLEKIKTVGDEYMVASGVPISRPDHVEAIADLALRIRDHTNATTYDGHQLQLGSEFTQDR